VIADVAQHEMNLVEIGQVIDELRFIGIDLHGLRACHAIPRKDRADAGESGGKDIATMHGGLPCHAPELR
jgi:hypothetical protein